MAETNDKNIEDQNLVKSVSAYMLEVNEMVQKYSLLQRSYTNTLGAVKELQQQLASTTKNIVELVTELSEKVDKLEKEMGKKADKID